MGFWVFNFGRSPMVLKINLSMKTRAQIFLLLAALAFSSRAAEIVLQSFEDGTRQGWVENREGWANGFVSAAVSVEAASEGTRSLKVLLRENYRRWGAYRTNLNETLAGWALQYGGTLQADVLFPGGSAGISEIGLAVEQPDVAGAMNWQEVWSGVNAATNRMTVSLAITRTGLAPVTLHLGQSSSGAGDKVFYLDNVRFVPNRPPIKASFVRHIARIADFTKGAEGFVAVAPGVVLQPTEEGTLVMTLPPGNRVRTAQRLHVDDPGWLSEVANGGKLQADITFEDSLDVTEVGLGIEQPDAGRRDEFWLSHQDVINVGLKSYTIVVPFARTGFGEVTIFVGHTATAPGRITLGNVRLVGDSPIGYEEGSLAMERLGKTGLRLYASGQPAAAENVEGPYTPLPRLQGEQVFDVELTGARKFFAPRNWLGLLFNGETDSTNEWQVRGEGWREINFSAHSGATAWGVAPSFTAGYPEGLSTSLLSPPIALTAAGSARLFFYDIVDIGGEDESDRAELFVRGPDGESLPQAPGAVYQASERASVFSWVRREVDLPASVIGKTVRLEFRFRADGFRSIPAQAGWFIDDVKVVLRAP
jgi:hypothetical protein